MGKEIVFKEPHKTDCRAMAAVRGGDWDTPWFLTGDTVYGDKRGGATGHTVRWFVCRCNDPDCPAKQLVNGDWLEKLVYLGARSKNNAKTD